MTPPPEVPGPPRIDGLLEACLYAEDLNQAEAFYSETLGLEVFARSDDRDVFFRCGQGMFLVFNPERTQTDESKAPLHGCFGPGHVAFRIASASVDAWKQRLSEHGVGIEREIEWPNGAFSIYFRDPAGNCVELATAKLWGI